MPILYSVVRELRFFFSHWTDTLAIVTLCLLASVGTVVGTLDVQEHYEQVERINTLSQKEMKLLTSAIHDPGSAGYYTFHTTENTPAPMAFSARGQTDIAPSILRVRLLALEGQIYENETINPELSLPGRFDFAFVLIYIAPLVLIALLHDLRSREREAGRLHMLLSLPHGAQRVFGTRLIVRAVLVSLACLLPLIAGAIYSGAYPIDMLVAASLVVALVGFWTLVSWAVGRTQRDSTAHAATLVTLWFGLTLVAPALAHLVINAAVPIPQGATIARENREAVNDGWDIPKEHTMEQFVALYPEWKGHTATTKSFEWKWYYAFHHLGDQHVAELSTAYRQGIARREAFAGWLSWALPPIAIQRGLHRLANTDVQAQLAYTDSVRDYHDKLRHFYYPYLFKGKAFEAKDFELTPAYHTTAKTPDGSNPQK